jgi:SSS family solute:Na+ symporter
MILAALSLILCMVAILYFRNAPAKTQAEYVVANRETKVYALISTLVMTEINPMAVITMASLGYACGYTALWMAFIAFISPLVAGLTTSQQWKSFDKSCVSELFDVAYGRLAGNTVRIILLPALIFLSSTYIKGLMIFGNNVFPNVENWQIALFVFFVCMFSTYRNGLSSIIKMDMIGFASLMILLAILMPTLIDASTTAGDHIPVSHNASLLPVSFLVSLAFLQIMMYSISPWWAQKIFSAKSKKVAYISSLTSSFLISLIYVFFILLGCLLRSNNIQLIDSQDALFTIFKEYVPHSIKWFFVATIILIGTTTICGVWSSISGMISAGFLRKSDNSSPVINYYVFGVLSVVSYFIAVNYIDNVLYCAILAVCQICSIYFSIVTIFFFRKSYLSTMLSICLTFFTNLILFWYFSHSQDYIIRWFSIAVPIMFLSGILPIIVNRRYSLFDWSVPR